LDQRFASAPQTLNNDPTDERVVQGRPGSTKADGRSPKAKGSKRDKCG